MRKDFSTVADVLMECEDNDHVRIIFNDRLITCGTWYMDNILDLGDRLVARVDFDNTSFTGFDIWNIFLK